MSVNSNNSRSTVGSVGTLLGRSEIMHGVRDLIARVAAARLPVLIEGETGTGKELVAQAIHVASGRRGRFIPFNVCAIPESIFESTLFGHVRGAYTGALDDADGFLVEADHGTAFFDEIGTLAAIAQGKLLRALETGAFRPVGARLDRRSDFRIVAAANLPLMQSVEAGTFRADLAHRLSGCVITLPPLRARREDIGLLVEHFGAQASARTIHFTPDALEVLTSLPWPGNVRELRLFVERAALLADGPTIATRQVQTMLSTSTSQSVFPSVSLPARAVHESGPRTFVASDTPGHTDADRVELLHLLDDAGWNTKRLATRLGIHRSTLYRRMTRLGIAPRRSF